MIYNVPGKKGVYSSYEMTDQEAKKLFGVDGEPEEPTSAASAPASSAPDAQAQKPQQKTMFSKLSESKYASGTSATTISRRL